MKKSHSTKHKRNQPNLMTDRTWLCWQWSV